MLDQDRITKSEGPKMERQPAVFLSHGSPMVAIEFDEWNESVCAFLEDIPRPSAIVIVSAHWETNSKVQVTSSPMPEILYDFDSGGYPETLYHLTYPCEGQPQLASEIVFMLNERGQTAELNEERGLDHGAWIPMYITFPNMDIPIVQVSIPKNGDPRKLYEIGKTLAPLRNRGILLVGSGNLVNNKKFADLDDKYADTDAWALEIDKWFSSHLKNFDINSLLDYQSTAPHLDKAVADKSHIMPFFFVLGSMYQKDRVVDLFEGFHYGNISMRSFALASRK